MRLMFALTLALAAAAIHLDAVDALPVIDRHGQVITNPARAEIVAQLRAMKRAGDLDGIDDLTNSLLMDHQRRLKAKEAAESREEEEAKEARRILKEQKAQQSAEQRRLAKVKAAKAAASKASFSTTGSNRFGFVDPGMPGDANKADAGGGDDEEVLIVMDENDVDDF